MGQLARAGDPRCVGSAVIEQGHIVWPELVVAARRGFTQALNSAAASARGLTGTYRNRNYLSSTSLVGDAA